jgi:hypothetical protein
MLERVWGVLPDDRRMTFNIVARSRRSTSSPRYPRPFPLASPRAGLTCWLASRGTLLYTRSDAAYTGRNTGIAYSISKAGLHALV